MVRALRPAAVSPERVRWRGSDPAPKRNPKSARRRRRPKCFQHKLAAPPPQIRPAAQAGRTRQSAHADETIRLKRGRRGKGAKAGSKACPTSECLHTRTGGDKFTSQPPAQGCRCGTQDCALHGEGGVASKTACSTSSRCPQWSMPPGLPCRRSRRQSNTTPGCTGVPSANRRQDWRCGTQDCALHANIRCGKP